jgi:membrane protein YdbS with pleckstrin-like domain
MSTIENSLGDGERVIATAKIHWWHTALSYAALLVPLLILIGVFHFLRDEARDAVEWEAIILVVMGAGVFVYRTLLKATTEISVTSRRFLKKGGLFSRQPTELPLGEIQGVKIRQSAWGRHFGFGSLRIEGEGREALEIPNIADPAGFSQAIAMAKGPA